MFDFDSETDGAHTPTKIRVGVDRRGSPSSGEPLCWSGTKDSKKCSKSSPVTVAKGLGTTSGRDLSTAFLGDAALAIDVARQEYWQNVEKTKSWMLRSTLVSFCMLLHHVAGSPRNIKMIDVFGGGENQEKKNEEMMKDWLDVQNVDIATQALQGMKEVKRNQISSDTKIAYITGFHNKHFSAIFAFVNIRTVLLYDGYSRNTPAMWLDWIRLLLWCLTCDEDNLPYTEVHLDSQKSFWELHKQNQEPRAFAPNTPWQCYKASDGILQDGDSTECGFLAGMNVWSKIYMREKDIKVLPSADCTLKNSRTAVIEQYNYMVNSLSEKGDLVMYNSQERADKAQQYRDKMAKEKMGRGRREMGRPN